MKSEAEYWEESEAMLQHLQTFGNPSDALIVLAYTLGRVFANVEDMPDADKAFAEFSRLLIGEFRRAFDTDRSAVNAAKSYLDHCRFFKCKGCGGNAVEFLEECPPFYPKGAVGHTKPIALAGTHGLVPCEVYRRLSAEEYRELHKDAPNIDPPEKFEPMV